MHQSLSLSFLFRFLLISFPSYVQLFFVSHVPLALSHVGQSIPTSPFRRIGSTSKASSFPSPTLCVDLYTSRSLNLALMFPFQVAQVPIGTNTNETLHQQQTHSSLLVLANLTKLPTQTICSSSRHTIADISNSLQENQSKQEYKKRGHGQKKINIFICQKFLKPIFDIEFDNSKKKKRWNTTRAFDVKER